ncbi:MAG: recombination regulator RecX [Moraxellaceae bacterium]|nr:recombination regulator RecX [Moraxellaceae bacterium]
MSSSPATALRNRALRLLARREHSRAELAAKLRGEAEPEMLAALLDRLAETGLQSDARYAESFVRSRAERHGVGRLRNELARRGVAETLIDDALATLADEGGGDEMARLRAVWQKKFGDKPQDAREWARQARFLQSRGFTSELIRKVLKEPFNDESA